MYTVLRCSLIIPRHLSIWEVGSVYYGTFWQFFHEIPKLLLVKSWQIHLPTSTKAATWLSMFQLGFMVRVTGFIRVMFVHTFFVLTRYPYPKTVQFGWKRWACPKQLLSINTAKLLAASLCAHLHQLFSVMWACRLNASYQLNVDLLLINTTQQLQMSVALQFAWVIALQDKFKLWNFC